METPLLAERTLEEQLTQLTPPQRRFLLYRIAGMDFTGALSAACVRKTSYNHWTMQETFKEVNSQVDSLHKEHQQEALKLIRRGNQLSMTLLETELINEMRLEISSGEYRLLRTPIAKEVYSKLMSELDAAQVRNGGPMTWEQNIAIIQQSPDSHVLSDIDLGRIQRANGQVHNNPPDSSQTDERQPSSYEQEAIQLSPPLLPRGISEGDARYEETAVT